MYKIESIQDQTKGLLPLTRDTERITYGIRMIIDGKVLTQPSTWKTTKIHRMSPNGILRLTFAQDLFNESTDVIEVNDKGVVVGMWADLLKEGVPAEPQPEPETNTYAEITYSGAQNRQLRVKGNYKKFTVRFYDSAGELNHLPGQWEFTIDGVDATPVVDVLTSDNDASIPEDQLRLKFIGGDEYIGKDIVISYTSDSGIGAQVTMNILGM